MAINDQFPTYFRPNGHVTTAYRTAMNGQDIHGKRSDPRPGKTANTRETGDVAKYQFRPAAIAMGSLTHRKFTQMLGAACEEGTDTRTQHGRSFLAFDFQRELLVIRAEMKIPRAYLPPALRPLDAELSFDDITSHGIHITEERGVGQAYTSNARKEYHYFVNVTISCRRPPKFYTAFEGSDSLFNGSKSKVYRRRATAMDFASTHVKPERDAGPIEAIPEGPCAYPTYWDTYRWSFNMSSADTQKLKDCAQKIRLLAERDPEMNLMSNLRPSLDWTIDRLDMARYLKLYALPDLSGVRFSARTLIEGLIAHGILRPTDTSDLLAAVQRNIVPKFQDRILESLYVQERIRNPTALVDKVASYLRRQPPPQLAHLVLVRTVLVTPTRLLVSPPQQEPSNSVTRRYKDQLDGIIRVQFIDEEDRLFVMDYVKQADNMRPDIGIMARVRRALQYGLIIGGQPFFPVASSASQQKDHAIWFISSRLIDGLELRKWMGTVHEKVVAKHAARMGLPFSTSRIVELQISMGKPLEDVKRNGYTFTDGVAAAGREVLKQAAKALGERQGLNATPSAIQFRLGGAKGVLADWPQLVLPYEVRLRPSLIKFESALNDLNVVRIAKYQTAFLNRQFINIMCANGVPTSLMVEIFSEAVRSIKGLRYRVQANEMTKDDHALIKQCSDFPLSQLIKAGFNNNPLLLDIAEIIECRALQDLKWRARVKLPGGVFLIGIADETGLLKENEVFCQFQENDHTEPCVVLNEVLVCRAPALHPGGVRRVWAVNCPELSHLKNVIVFNTKGKRDLPNMLGGGDLDGDDYTLIWDQRFVRALNMYDPMDYTAPPPVTVDGQVTQNHLNENFVQYILNDVLGQVDNCHLALSDTLGPFAPECLHLSTIHSMAVDFAKTGQAATLDPKLRPKTWPDFMDKDDVKKIYRSEGVLGELFRIVQPDPHFSPSDLKNSGYPVDPRITRFDLHDSVLARLRPVKAHYEKQLQFNMRRYRVFEVEIPSGIAIRNKRRKRARDQNLNEPLRDTYQTLVNEARAMAKEAVTNIKFNTRLTPPQLVARHCYALTFEQKYVEDWQESLSRGEWYGEMKDEDMEDDLRPRPMYSFAWCFWQELIEIAALSDGQEC